MKDTEDRIGEYYLIKPFQYKHLKSIKMDREILDGCIDGYSLELILQSFEYKLLKLKFKGVINVRFGDLDSMPGIQLEIRSLKGQQIENINYRIVDVENEIVSFLCEKIEKIEELGELS